MIGSQAQLVYQTHGNHSTRGLFVGELSPGFVIRFFHSFGQWPVSMLLILTPDGWMPLGFFWHLLIFSRVKFSWPRNFHVRGVFGMCTETPSSIYGIRRFTCWDLSFMVRTEWIANSLEWSLYMVIVELNSRLNGLWYKLTAGWTLQQGILVSWWGELSHLWQEAAIICD
jgi:hypothetical protein